MEAVAGRKFSILGLARSGLAAANHLAAQGADVLVSDRQPVEKLPSSRLDPRVQVHAGENFVRAGDVVVISPGIKPDTPAWKLAHEKGSEVISDIELFYRLCPCPIIAVTGTDGKSTTTALIGELAAASGRRVFVGGNIGNGCMEGLVRLDAGAVAVLEVSCFQLTHCCRFRPAVAVVTNIAEDHMDYHGSFAAYVEAKKRVFQAMGAGDLLVLHGEDVELARWELPARVEVKRFGWHEGLDAWSDGESVFLAGREGRLVGKGELKLVGRHNLENVMTAVLAVEGRFGRAEEYVGALRRFPGLEHRMQYVATVRGVSFYNDSKATNPHAAAAVVNAFAERFVLLAGGYDKGSDFTEFGRLVADRTKAAVLYGRTRERIGAAIPAGHCVRVVETMEEAIRAGYALAAAGEKVILAPACASFDQFTDFEHRGRVFAELVLRLKAEQEPNG